MKSTLGLVGVFAYFLATCVEGVPLIVGGAFASPREFPYVVGVGHFSEDGDPSFCGGGIIDEKFILTAAHCVTQKISPDDLFDNAIISEFRDWWVFVYANTMNFQDDLRKSMTESRSGLYRTNTSSTTRRVVKTYILSEYLANGADDIAVLELESPLNLNDGHLRKLELPSRGGISYEGELGVVAGFGEDSPTAYYDPPNEEDYFGDYAKYDPNHENDGTLKKAHFRIVPTSRCIYRPDDPLQRNTFCMIAVTEDNKRPDRALGACNGDSGSPFVQGNTVIGIMISTSLFTCDAREAFPQSSVKVGYYKDFIDNVIGNPRGHLGNDQTITEFEFRA